MAIVLFIDDYEQILKSIKRLVDLAVDADTESQVAYATCSTTESALAAIAAHQPEIIFLDHNLGEKGGEGLIVLRELMKNSSSVKVYSTTTDGFAHEEYRKLGVEIAKKGDNDRILHIIRQALST
ncbi:MAG TPA: cyclic-phosphate processing receiver domain-containing protein [Candidatus Saccharimonadales bacterium]|nr:cyclic-phosphate processing receiver domain-containing protein [Candidatus Saccharimonadales bacterium]